MGSPEGAPRIRNLGEALGSDGESVSGYSVPEVLLEEPPFVLLLKAYIGRNWAALQSGRTTSAWEPRQLFFSFMHDHNHVSSLNSLLSVADLYFRTPGLRASDFGLLFKLWNFLRDFTDVPLETLQTVKGEIELRASVRREREAWAEHRRIGEEREKNQFLARRRPVLRVQGVSNEDLEDVLIAEWEELLYQRRQARARNLQTGELVPEPPESPGISVSERSYAQSLARGLLAGEGQNWLIRSQLRTHVYPNQFSDEEYFRLACLELLDRDEERLQAGPVKIPRLETLTRAEKAVVRQVRAKVLGGRRIFWDEIANEQEGDFPNQLSKVQFLALAAKIPSAEPQQPGPSLREEVEAILAETSGRQEEASEECYFSAPEN